MRKDVLVGNPVVTLDNISVFAKKERQEEIVKHRVRYLKSLVLMEFLLNSNAHKTDTQVYSCMFDGLIGGSHNYLYLGMKQGKALTIPCLFLFNSLITAPELVQSSPKDTHEPKRFTYRLPNIFQNIFL